MYEICFMGSFTIFLQTHCYNLDHFENYQEQQKAVKLQSSCLTETKV